MSTPPRTRAGAGSVEILPRAEVYRSSEELARIVGISTATLARLMRLGLVESAPRLGPPTEPSALDLEAQKQVALSRALLTEITREQEAATKQAQKDAKKLVGAGLRQKAETLLEILAENPFQNPPPYEKLIGDLDGAYSRRINIQHRLVYRS